MNVQFKHIPSLEMNRGKYLAMKMQFAGHAMNNATAQEMWVDVLPQHACPEGGLAVSCLLVSTAPGARGHLGECEGSENTTAVKRTSSCEVRFHTRLQGHLGGCEGSENTTAVQ